MEHIGSAVLARDARAVAATNFTGQFPLVARRARIIDAWEQPARPARSNVIPVGARVFHQKFGYGRVTAVENDRLDVTFERAGEKRVLDR